MRAAVRDDFDPNKRRTMAGLLVTAGVGSIGGLKGSVSRASDAQPALDCRYAFLAPLAVNPFDAPLKECIDVHAHFFNASDVTVEGYLEGPVAHSFGALGWLVQLLARIADGLGAIAISAKEELQQLPLVEQQLAEVREVDVPMKLRKIQDKERQKISAAFNELTKTSRGQAFRRGYEAVMRGSTASSGLLARHRIQQITDDSLADAMYMGEEIRPEDALAAFEVSDRGFYAEGLLAFIGYMLSSRWANLNSYRHAMTTGAHTIGVSRVLGALVNFDRWLDGRVRSPHEDQLELHAELSRRSLGYMQPIMSYNPWTDIAEQDRALHLIEQAERAKFVGVKIYPANGFRAYGNAALPNLRGRPTGAQLDAALRKFWLRCRELGMPVMSHAAPRMGKNDKHDLMGAPGGWEAVLQADFWPDATGPSLNLGHFGGDQDHPRKSGGAGWPEAYVDLMRATRGEKVYADLGYWSDLQCARQNSKCRNATERLKRALNYPAGGGRVAADRVMFGTDWLMLSREKDWTAYPRRLLKTIEGIAPNDVEKIFALNAKNCFSRLP